MSKLPPDDQKPGSGNAPEPGRRKDGKPFKDGNTREDGSFEIGRNRAPKDHQFAVGDGRKRGRRAKGSKNLRTIWTKKLHQKIRHEGKEQTAAEWLVEGLIRRGISSSDRAAETALSQAEHLEGERERQLRKSDTEIIEDWLAERLAQSLSNASDDFDRNEGGGQDQEVRDSDGNAGQ